MFQIYELSNPFIFSNSNLLWIICSVVTLCFQLTNKFFNCFWQFFLFLQSIYFFINCADFILSDIIFCFHSSWKWSRPKRPKYNILPRFVLLSSPSFCYVNYNTEASVIWLALCNKFSLQYSILSFAFASVICWPFGIYGAFVSWK